MSEAKLNLVICGAGAGAHVLVALAFQNPRFCTTVFSTYKNKVELWRKALDQKDLVVKHHGGNVMARGKPSCFTRDGKEAIFPADLIIICTPSYGHDGYLRDIRDYLRKGATIVALPCGSGLDFACYSILGDRKDDVNLVFVQCLPWSCRIVKLFEEVNVIGIKEHLPFGTRIGSVAPSFDIQETLQSLLGKNPQLIQEDCLLSYTIDDPNLLVHPAIMYGQWHDWDGQPVKEKPLFYHGIDQKTCDLVQQVNNEVLLLKDAIVKLAPHDYEFNAVLPIAEMIEQYYHGLIKDHKSIYAAFHSGSAWDGVYHPMIPVEDGFVPDFKNRYLTEDIPHGLCVLHGIAEIVGVNTPNIDKLISWAQSLLGKEYLTVQGKLSGKDLVDTRCPQKYGLSTVEQLLGI